MSSRILVTGGTGTLGRHVVLRLRDAGCEVRVLSRRTHEAADGIEYVTGDLLKDEGIQAVVDGAGIIVHCAGNTVVPTYEALAEVEQCAEEPAGQQDDESSLDDHPDHRDVEDRQRNVVRNCVVLSSSFPKGSSIFFRPQYPS